MTFYAMLLTPLIRIHSHLKILISPPRATSRQAAQLAGVVLGVLLSLQVSSLWGSGGHYSQRASSLLLHGKGGWRIWQQAWRREEWEEELLASMWDVHHNEAEQITRTRNNTSNNKENTDQRILCWIPLKEHNSPLISRIWQSWGPRCDELVFISSKGNSSLGVIGLQQIEEAQGLWNKVHVGWTYIIDKYLEEFDWFVKLDDDTYFSPDNFKHVVRSVTNPHEEFAYIGHRLFHIREPFNAGAAYAVTQATLRRVAKHLPYYTGIGNNNTEVQKCPIKETWAEDVEFRSCLRRAGVSTSFNTWDKHGRDYFHPLSPLELYTYVRTNQSRGWFYRNKPSFMKGGTRCCASHPVNFHHIKETPIKDDDESPILMFALDYLLYFAAIDPVPGMMLDSHVVVR